MSATTSSSIDNLRKKLAEQWAGIDADGDGTISGAELTHAFDADGDGKVSSRRALPGRSRAHISAGRYSLLCAAWCLRPCLFLPSRAPYAHHASCIRRRANGALLCCPC